MGFLSKMFGGKQPSFEPDETYLSMRQQILDLAREDSDPGDGGIRAVMMDSGFDDNCFTFVAVADGTLSIYISNGGGTIGTGAWQKVNSMTRDFVRGAAQSLGHLEPTGQFPLPAVGQTGIYFVGKGEVSSAHHKTADLGNNKLPLSPLFHRAHHLIGVIRQLSEDQQREEPLVFASQVGEVEQAREELAKGAGANTKSTAGIPVAGVAIRSGSTEVLRMLLDGDADVNVRFDTEPSDNSTLLGMAAGADESDCVEMLIEAGARIDDQEASGMTALHIASHLGHVRVVAALIARGANVESTEHCGYTPLMMAANSGMTGSVRVLLDHGAQPNATDSQGSSPIMFAAQHDNPAVIELLLAKGADPNVLGTHGLSAIDFASQNGHDDIAQLMQK
jgi:ankyrin repeat protein